ncbi:MAG: hypothetical protein QM820_52790 [Minicystis sp.]
MRLSTTIDVHLPSEPLPRPAPPRAPSLWERIKRAFGVNTESPPEEARQGLEASMLVSDLREALRPLGITNAVSLVVDGHVVFTDPHGTPDDFGDLVLALSEQAPIFGGGFRTLRLAVEHLETGLHYVVEIACEGEHEDKEPNATVRVGARVRDLEPRPGESAEEYRERIAPLATDTVLLETHKRQFETFVGRLSDALRAAFPTAQIQEREPEAKLVRPTAEPAPIPVGPTDPAYDPYQRYYPNPFEGMLSGMLLGSLLTSAFRPPGLMIVHPSGAPITSAEDLDAHTAELSPDARDPGAETVPIDIAGSEGASMDEGYAGDGIDTGDGGDWGEDMSGIGDDSF